MNIMILLILFLIIAAMLLIGAVLRRKAHPSWTSVIQIVGALIIVVGYSARLALHPYPFEMPKEEGLLNQWSFFLSLCNVVGGTLFSIGYVVESRTNRRKHREEESEPKN
jgi:hypothetical protein